MPGLYGPGAVGQAQDTDRASLAGRARRALDRARGRGARFVPPRRLRADGEQAFVEAGEARLRLLVGLAKVRPDERVLELGFAPGVIARPLAGYLGPGATYHGLDADRRAVEWARRAYRDRPDFAFALDEDGPLPFADAAFDLVVAAGPLARWEPEVTAARLREARRVLAPEGRLFATAFLLDERARAAIARGEAAIAFGPLDGEHAAAPGGTPLALDEEWLLDRVAEAGFRSAGIRHGTWTPRENGRSHEDVLVARR